MSIEYENAKQAWATRERIAEEDRIARANEAEKQREWQTAENERQRKWQEIENLKDRTNDLKCVV